MFRHLIYVFLLSLIVNYTHASKEECAATFSKIKIQNIFRGTAKVIRPFYQKESEAIDLENKDATFFLKNPKILKEKFQGMEGYIAFADRFFDGDMNAGYLNFDIHGTRTISTYLMFLDLNWIPFIGTTGEFHQIASTLLDSDREIREEFKGVEGYIKFSDEYYYGGMDTAYVDASDVISSLTSAQKFNELGWSLFPGTTKKLNKIKSILFNSDGTFKERFKGVAGYVTFADEYYHGDMSRAHKYAHHAVDSLTSAHKFNELGWSLFPGTTKKLNKIKSILFNSDGTFKERFKGVAGYADFSDEYYYGNKKTAYLDVSYVINSLMGAHKFNELGWNSHSFEMMKKIPNFKRKSKKIKSF